MIFSIANGPLNLTASFLDSTHRRRSWVESHSLCPTWYMGAWEQIATDEGLEREAGKLFSRAGKRGGCHPCAHWNRDKPVAELVSMLCAYSTHNRCWDQDEGFFRSVWPLDWGWDLTDHSPKLLAELPPEDRCELGSSVRHHIYGETMKPEDMEEDQAGSFHGTGELGQGH